MEVKNILFGFCLIYAIHASNDSGGQMMDSGGQMMMNATLPIQGIVVIRVLRNGLNLPGY